MGGRKVNESTAGERSMCTLSTLGSVTWLTLVLGGERASAGSQTLGVLLAPEPPRFLPVAIWSVTCGFSCEQNGTAQRWAQVLRTGNGWALSGPTSQSVRPIFPSRSQAPCVRFCSVLGPVVERTETPRGDDVTIERERQGWPGRTWVRTRRISPMLQTRSFRPEPSRLPAVNRGRPGGGSACRRGRCGPVCEARTSTWCLRVSSGNAGDSWPRGCQERDGRRGRQMVCRDDPPPCPWLCREPVSPDPLSMSPGPQRIRWGCVIGDLVRQLLQDPSRTRFQTCRRTPFRRRRLPSGRHQ